MQRNVVVATGDATLRRAVRMTLSTLNALVVREGPVESVAEGEIAIVTEAECPVRACADLAQRGVLLVVLSPAPAPTRQARYLEAGAAAYVPMVINGVPLRDQVLRVAGLPPLEAHAPCER